MEHFLKAAGMRKVFIGVVYYGTNALLLYGKVLPADNFQVISLALIAGFFAGNVFENKAKSEKAPSEPTADK